MATQEMNERNERDGWRMNMQVAKRFTPETRLLLRTEITNAGGNEVFALGRCNGEGLIAELRITARGNEDSVPALQLEPEDGYSPDTSWDVFIHNHPSGFLVPSDNDMLIASRAAQSGMGAYIVNNELTGLYVVAEPVRRRKRKNLDADELGAALEEGGTIARRLGNYERRDAQLDLVRFLTRAFNEDAVAAAEAGTGVGKSFAYLLPAVEFALANDERVVISTATITLQQQLYEKDIPLVLSALGKEVKYTLVKGRGNYLCLRRLGEALMEPPLEDGEYEELRALTAWSEQTKTGGRSDLSFLPGPGLWSRVCCEADTCLGMHCAERERCFFLALRREAADSRLLVVNHHLLFADLAARHEGAGYEASVVLPPYTRVIIDEAHTVEDAATSFFSKEWSRIGINHTLGRLYRKRRARESGLLVRLVSPLPPRIPGAIAAVREAAEKADAAALALCGEEGLFRLIPEKGAAILFPPLEELRRALSALVPELILLTEAADQEDPAVWEIRAVIRRLDSVGAICGAFLDYGIRGEETGDVYWIEKQNSAARDPWAVLSVTPVDIAPSLRDALFDVHKTVICVSATLGAGSSGPVERAGERTGSFRFWAERTGAALGDRKPLYAAFPSPFPYSGRTLLIVPADAPLPDTAEYQAFLSRAVTELVRIAGGSALVLFTSYRSLRTTFDEAAPPLEREGIRCLKQGDDDRNRLLQVFLADKASVLFGTDSFWEGVDAPGETLRLVILCRLPFRALRDPVFEARRELLEKRGRNAFAELSLPDAVMKFKQGFGRLMRSSRDYGAVAALDGRLLHKRYGAVFLGSLPETKTSFKNLEGVLEDLERFLY
ncbi:MAG: ATP-dependent DNA helicase DinG [Treponema sp.]|jgi:ATP-dependent DNA helicase DinG|nr:ATP-dependent DNA helicase DinG [Treponema sp.]